MADPSVQAPIFTPNQVSQEEEMREVAIVHQVEWYFSRENLIADFFLKRQMNEELWVKLSIIIDFPKMLNLKVTQKDAAHLAHLLKTRSQIIEVDSTNSFIRPIWAVRSTLHLKGIPTNISAVAIHGFLESISDASMPSWVHIHQDQHLPVWSVVFNSFDGAAKAVSKVNGQRFNGNPVVAEVKEETRNSMIGDAAILLESGIPVYTPPGTPAAFYATTPDMMQVPAAARALNQGAPHNGPGQQPPVGMVQGYANMAQPMMPISIGVQGMPPHQGHPQVNGPYGYMPNPGYNGGGYSGNGVPQHMMQRGYNGGPSAFYIPYGGGHGYDPAAHAHAMQQQQHGRGNSDSSNGNANADAQPAPATHAIQQQLAGVQLQSPGASSPVPGRAGPRNPDTPGTPGGAGPSRPHNNRRSLPRHGGHPHHHGPPAVMLAPQDAMGIAPGAPMNVAGMGPGALRVMPGGVPVDSKGVPMQFVGMAHTLPNTRQPHLVMQGARMGNGGMPAGMPGDRAMRGYNSGPGGKQHRNHQPNGDGTSRGAGPSRNSNGMPADMRGPGNGKKNKKAGRNHNRQAGAHAERSNPINYDGKPVDPKNDGGPPGSRDERRTSIEEKKKPEPNLNNMYFPPLPGASADGNGTVAVGSTKNTPKAASTHSETESNVTVSPDQGRPGDGDALLKDELSTKVLPSAASVANGGVNGAEGMNAANANGSMGKGPGAGAISEDRLSTTSSSGGSDHAGSAGTRETNSNTGMTYAAILRKKGAASAAIAAPVAARNVANSASPNINRGSGSKPSSPSVDAALKASAATSGDLTRRRSYVGATTPEGSKVTPAPAKTGTGNGDVKLQTDPPGKSASPRAAPFAPSNRPMSVWANKPRSLFEAASSSPVSRSSALAPKQVPSPPPVSSAAPQLSASVAASAPADKAREARTVEPSTAVLSAKGGDGDTSVQSEGSSVTQPEANGAPFLTEKVSAESAASASEGASVGPVANAKGAWAAGGPKKWVATKESSGISGKLES